MTSMNISLAQILTLVGTLDDSQGSNTARERFRSFLTQNVTEVGQARDHIDECLRDSGDQYSRALQDLVNHIGHFLGFEVTFGRYQGVRGQVGFDGHWASPTGFHIVAEVKTTEVYAIDTATLANYVNSLISQQEIPSWDEALGLYVIGRPDPKVRQLQNAIVAERRADQLRIISIDALLSLAELMNEYDIDHEAVLDVLRPSGPTIDPLVGLMSRLVASRQPENLVAEAPATYKIELDRITSAPTPDEDTVAYWLTSVSSDEEATAEQVVQTLVGQEKLYAFGDRTPGRRTLKPGDWVCFYAAGKGMIAHAQVVSYPAKEPHPQVRHNDRYPWTFQLEETHLYIDDPIILDANLRSEMDAFSGRDPNRAWAWFVQATRKITEHDFGILTGPREAG